MGNGYIQWTGTLTVTTGKTNRHNLSVVGKDGESQSNTNNGHREQEYTAANQNGNHTASEQTDEDLNTFTFAELLEKEFEPLQWIIAGYLPEGATLLFSKPKVGKSMLVLALILRMAMLRNADEVLYLSLDDKSERRLQDRIRSILGGSNIKLDHVHGSIHSGTLSSNLIAQLNRWMTKHPFTKLIAIDVYARIKPKKKDDDVFKTDYDAVVSLQDFAVKHHVAIILIHHTNKRSDVKDWIDSCNGSTGLTAAPDTLWTVEREPKSNNLMLRIRGRDIIGEPTVKLSLDGLEEDWSADDEDEQEVVKAEDKILTIFRLVGSESLKPKEVAEKSGLKLITAQVTLRRMHSKGIVSQTTYGSYTLVETYRLTNFRTYIGGHDASSNNTDDYVDMKVCKSVSLQDTEKAQQYEKAHDEAPAPTMHHDIQEWSEGDPMPDCPECGDNCEVALNILQRQVYCTKHHRVIQVAVLLRSENDDGRRSSDSKSPNNGTNRYQDKWCQEQLAKLSSAMLERIMSLQSPEKGSFGYKVQQCMIDEKVG